MTTTALSPERIQAIAAARAQEKLDDLFREKREDIITTLAYRLHQDDHNNPEVKIKPAWSDSQKLATEHFDGALDLIATATREAAAVKAAQEESAAKEAQEALIAQAAKDTVAEKDAEHVGQEHA